MRDPLSIDGKKGEFDKGLRVCIQWHIDQAMVSESAQGRDDGALLTTTCSRGGDEDASIFSNCADL